MEAEKLDSLGRKRKGSYQTNNGRRRTVRCGRPHGSGSSSYSYNRFFKPSSGGHNDGFEEIVVDFELDDIDLVLFTTVDENQVELLPSSEEKSINILDEDKSETKYVGRVIDEIIDILGITIKQLAKICHVNERTPYNWRKDIKLDRQTKGMDRLFLLSRIAKNWRGAGYSKPGVRMQEPLLEDKSLMNYLTAEVIDEEAIQFIGGRIYLDKLGDKKPNNPFI